MAIDVAALATLGIDTVWNLIPASLTPCTLRDRPVPVHDPGTGDDAVTWGASVGLSAFLYDDKKSGEDVPPSDLESKMRLAIVRVSDAAGMGEITTKAELLETGSGYLWNVEKTTTPPGGAFHILNLRR